MLTSDEIIVDWKKERKRDMKIEEKNERTKQVTESRKICLSCHSNQLQLGIGYSVRRKLGSFLEPVPNNNCSFRMNLVQREVDLSFLLQFTVFMQSQVIVMQLKFA